MNKIQVFGLPSSGTNFIEWTLNNNFVDINYQNLYTTWGAIYDAALASGWRPSSLGQASLGQDLAGTWRFWGREAPKVPAPEFPLLSLTEGAQFRGRPISVKHGFPTLDYSPCVIIIYKTYSVWQASFRKRKVHDPRFFEEKSCYNQYLYQATRLPAEKTIIIEYSWAVRNYFILLDMIADKFNVKKIQNPRQPANRLAGGGGATNEFENNPFFGHKIDQY